MKTPAMLGGSPTFEKMLNIVGPGLPTLDMIAERLSEALATGNLTNNSRNVRQLEAEMRDYLGGADFIAVSNGTAAPQMAFERLGVKGEVICPSFSYIATASAIVAAGCTPVFADIDPQTWNITAETVRPHLNERTAAIMPVHVFGNPCEIDELEALAKEANLKLIFDSAHAVGASYKGRKIGCFGDAETYSFHATKTLPMGEGGGIATRNPQLAEDLRAARVFGDYGDHDCVFPSGNSKMQEFSAILGLVGLKKLDANIASRKDAVELYRKRLGTLPGLSFQTLNPDGEPSFQNFTLVMDAEAFGLSRDELHDVMTAENIMTRKYFFPAIHRQKAYAESNAHLPVTDHLCDRVLCLPLHNFMALSLVETICEAVEAAHSNASQLKETLLTGAF